MRTPLTPLRVTFSHYLVTLHNVTSGQKAPLRRILHNFRLRIRTSFQGSPEGFTWPLVTSGSPGTCTTAIVGKNAGESRACAEHASGHFWSGPHSGMCLPVTCLTSLPVTWLPVAPPPPRPTEHSGWLLCEAWGCPFRSGWFANMVSSYAFVVIKGPSLIKIISARNQDIIMVYEAVIKVDIYGVGLATVAPNSNICCKINKITPFRPITCNQKFMFRKLLILNFQNCKTNQTLQVLPPKTP
jgi:hypothetical protein